MSRRKAFIVLLSFSLVWSCGGGRRAPVPQEHLLPAAKILAKGVSFYREGCYDRSLEWLLRAHELYTAADDRAGAATALNNIGNVHRAGRDGGVALLYYDAAAEMFAEISHAQGRVQSLVNSASVLIESGRLPEAEAALEAARAAAGKGQDPPVSWMLAHGNLLAAKGEDPAAEAELVRALEIAGSEAPEAVSGLHYALARLLLENDRPQEAAGHAKDALDEDRKSGAFRKTADDLLLLGEALLRIGRALDAAAAFRRAMNIYALLGDAGAVSEAASRLKSTGADTLHPLTVEFVEQWLRGDIRSGICR